MSDQSEVEELQVRMKANGDLIQRIDGHEVIVAHYDKTSGGLEFSTREYSVKLYNQVVAKISTVNKGTQPSTNVIRSITVKGDPKVAAGGSKRPKMGPEGDGTPVVVDWYVKNALSEAIIRYGIFTDDKGNPIRKKVQRTVELRVDNRDGEAESVPTPRVGQSHEGGPVKRTRQTFEVRNAIIARRATRYEDDPDILADLGVDKLEALFIPQEVVGGWQPEEDFDAAPAMAETEDAT